MSTTRRVPEPFDPPPAAEVARAAATVVGANELVFGRQRFRALIPKCAFATNATTPYLDRGLERIVAVGPDRRRIVLDDSAVWPYFTSRTSIYIDRDRRDGHGVRPREDAE